MLNRFGLRGSEHCLNMPLVHYRILADSWDTKCPSLVCFLQMLFQGSTPYCSPGPDCTQGGADEACRCGVLVVNHLYEPWEAASLLHHRTAHLMMTAA